MGSLNTLRGTLWCSWEKNGWSRRRTLAALSRMDSYRTYLATGQRSDSWPEDQEEDVYEVESRVPLPFPYPLSEHLDDSNSVTINTSVFHFTHRRNGHIIKLISKISLPTPPYSVSIQWCFRTTAKCNAMGTALSHWGAGNRPLLCCWWSATAHTAELGGEVRCLLKLQLSCFWRQIVEQAQYSISLAPIKLFKKILHVCEILYPCVIRIQN